MLPQESARSISSPAWREKLTDVYMRLGILQVQEMIWDRLLTAPERNEVKRLGWPDRAVNFTKIWMARRGMSQPRAIIELGRGVGVLSEADREWLLREIGELDCAARSRRGQKKPNWDPDHGELTMGGVVIRRVRGRTVARRIIAILEAFQRLGWPKRVDHPDPDVDSQTLRESVQSLNRGLSLIRFEADGTGRGIRWKRQ